MEEKHRWFIKPLNIFTKDVVCQSLQELNQVAEPTRIVDNEGTPHKVWEVDYSFIAYLQKSQEQVPTEFIVFMKIGNVVQRWELHKYLWGHRKNQKINQVEENSQLLKSRYLRQ